MALTFGYMEYGADGTTAVGTGGGVVGGADGATNGAGIKYGTVIDFDLTPASNPITAGNNSWWKMHRMKFKSGTGEQHTVTVNSIERTDATPLSGSAKVRRGVINDTFETPSSTNEPTTTGLLAISGSGVAGDADWTSASAAVTGGAFTDASSTSWATGLQTASGGSIFTEYIKTQITTTSTSSSGTSSLVFTATYTVSA